MSLCGALGYPRFAKRISSTGGSQLDAFLMLELDSTESFLLSICGVNHEVKECRLWSLCMTEEVIRRHMEDDVGICDEDGIKSFAPRMAAALRKNLYFDSSALLEESNALSMSRGMSLYLVYDIGDLRADTTIEIPLVQRGLDPIIFKLMTPSELLAPPPLSGISNQPISSLTGPLTEASTATLLVSGHNAVTTDDVDKNAYITQPEAAKRRKGGGVKLMGGGRRR